MTLLITSHYCVDQRDEDVEKKMSGPSHFRFDFETEQISKTDLSEKETQDNVSMHNFKNTLTAFVRQVGRGGNTKWQ